MARVRLATLGFGTGSFGWAAGCNVDPFACIDDGACRSMAGIGRCESSGHCSFPDLDCPLGYRYGEHSGELSGACVERPSGGSDDGSSASPLSDGDGTLEGGNNPPDVPPNDDGPADDAADDAGDGSTSGSYETTGDAPAEGDSGGATGGSTPVEGARVLLVEDQGDASPGDAAIAARLLVAGYDVTAIDEGVADPDDAEAFDLVMISSTVSSAGLSNKYRAVPVPIVVWEHGLYDDMGMSNGGDGDTHATAIEILDPEHPLAAGLSGTVTVFHSSVGIRFGVPVGQAKSIARTTDAPPRIVYFAYDEGDVMQGLSAPARRLGLFLGDDSAEALTPAGWSLFDAAVAWALGN